jgi:hypothetical protein
MEVSCVQRSTSVKPRPGLLVQAAKFRPLSRLPLEDLNVVLAEVLAPWVELLVNRPLRRLAIEVLKHIPR